MERAREPAGRRRIGLFFTAGLFAGLTVSCDAHSAPPPLPNIVVVLVDQLRKDAADRWMPEVRELAGRGVVFENMRAAAPWTYPSVISLFSGLYPQQHGADGEPTGGKRLSTFDPSLPLLPDLLGERYYSAAFVTNPFLQRWNPFAVAFDHYAIDEFVGSMGNLRGYPRLAWTRDMFADSVNRVIREHFDARTRNEPEFVYVHYVDVHGPWDGAPFDVGPPTPPEALNERAYEAGARYVDRKIAELYDYFSRRYAREFLFLVTSDHGQELGDDLAIGEGEPLRKRKSTVHDFNTRIPLFLLPGRSVPVGEVVEIPCSNVDLVPTLLDWIGMPIPANLSGRSLRAAILGETQPADWHRPIYSKMSAFNRSNDCIVVGSKKLMRQFDPSTGVETGRVAFDLAADPREALTLSPAAGPASDLLEQAASTAGIEYPKRFEKPDAQTLERLRALGYFE